MMSCLAVSVAAVLAADPQVGLVLAKRSGVNRALALERVELVRRALAPEAVGAGEDLTSCGGKLPCLAKTARARGWSALLVVETATILGEAIVDVRLLSMEDDGKVLASANAQEAERGLAAMLPARLAPVRDALRTLTGPPPPLAIASPAAVLVAEPPPPTPPPAPVAPPLTEIEASPDARPAARWVPLGVSLAIVVAGAVSLGVSRSVAGRLSTERLGDVEIDSLVSTGKTLHALGLSGLIGGGVLTAASLLLAIAWPAAPVRPTATWLPGGGAIGFVGSWP